MNSLLIIPCASAQAQAALNALPVMVQALDSKPELLYFGALTGELRGYRRCTAVDVGTGMFPQADAVADYISSRLGSDLPDLIVLPADMLGNEIAAALANQLHCGCLLNAEAIRPAAEGILVKKPVYSMNLHAEFCCNTFPVVLTAAVSATDPLETDLKATVEQDLSGLQIGTADWLEDPAEEPTVEENPLLTAKTVLAAGRGVGSKDNADLIRQLAASMGGSFGATRPVVYDSWADKSEMVGASSALLSPQFCMVFGASGAAPFAAGVEKSKLLVAINNDPDAAIFRISDVGIVADCIEVAQALREIILKEDI